MLDLMANILSYLPAVLSVLGALTLLVTAIAKLTPTEADNKLAGFLESVHDFLAKLALRSPLAEKRVGAAVVRAGATVVVDHRAKK